MADWVGGLEAVSWRLWVEWLVAGLGGVGLGYGLWLGCAGWVGWAGDLG